MNEKLTKLLRDYLDKGRFDPDARLRTNILPLAGIYWSDEVSDWREIRKWSDAERHQLFRLFAVRFRIWDSVAPDHADWEFWEAARRRSPSHPLFQRLELTPEHREPQEQITRDVDELETALANGADEWQTTEKNGVRRFSAMFNPTDRGSTPQPWWSRLWRRVRRPFSSPR